MTAKSSLSAPVSPGLLSQLVVTLLAYVAAVALVSLCIFPAILAPLPLSAFAPERPIVARAPVPEFAP